MKDYHPTIQTTKNNTLGSSQPAQAEVPKLSTQGTAERIDLSTIRDSQEGFYNQIYLAKAKQIKEIEVSDTVIKSMFPNGLGEIEMFHYQGVMCFREGKMDEVKMKMGLPVYKKLHGNQESTNSV